MRSLILGAFVLFALTTRAAGWRSEACIEEEARQAKSALLFGQCLSSDAELRAQKFKNRLNVPARCESSFLDFEKKSANLHYCTENSQLKYPSKRINIEH